jgi:signal peptidase I
MNEAPSHPEALESPSTWRSTKVFLLEIIKVVAIALVIIWPVRTFLIQPFYVKGQSMEPNFYNYEYLIVDELSYRFREPVRGEVVVLRDPRVNHRKQFFIKRIVGLPEEQVRIQDGNVMITNADHPEGFLLEEDYIPEETITASGGETVTLKSGEYFVLGDNREHSYDSRYVGPFRRNEIIGRVWLRAWPPMRAEIFGTPIATS